MVQSARGVNSRSLLREAETALLLIEDEKSRKWFEEAIKKLVDNRRNPEKTMTGAKELRTNLLAYLEQFGEVKTANIWCRNIVYSEIKDFLKALQEELARHDLKGIVELHLQDREINSPHIQYVGTNAEEAQIIIADFLIQRGYEDSLGSALMNNHIPAYRTEEAQHLRVKKTDDEVKEQERIEQITEHKRAVLDTVKDLIADIRSLKDSFVDMMKEELRDLNIIDFGYKNEIKKSTSKRTMALENRHKTTEELLSDWSERATQRRRARRQ